jgi:hypothetical protein
VRRELVLLVLHQRDERADDERQPGQHEGGELVDERLAAARGHDDERVRAAQHGLDRLVLPVLEVVVAEALREDAPRALARQGARALRRRFCRVGGGVATRDLAVVGAGRWGGGRRVGGADGQA